MSANTNNPHTNNEIKPYKEICHYRYCNSDATEEKKVNVGVYGMKTFKFCKKCLKLFESEF